MLSVLQKPKKETKMNKITNQHGDLIFVEAKSIPKEAKEVEVYKGLVLERGEGVHTHILEDTEGVKVYELDGNIYVKVDRPTRINHEEHGIQILTPGIKKKGIERVWDYEADEARKTLD